jgi:hypothetical protein
LRRIACRSLLVHPSPDGGIIEKVDQLVDLRRDAGFDAVGGYGLLGDNGTGGCQEERQCEKNHSVQTVGMAIHHPIWSPPVS